MISHWMQFKYYTGYFIKNVIYCSLSLPSPLFLSFRLSSSPTVSSWRLKRTALQWSWEGSAWPSNWESQDWWLEVHNTLHAGNVPVHHSDVCRSELGLAVRLRPISTLKYHMEWSRMYWPCILHGYPTMDIGKEAISSLCSNIYTSIPFRMHGQYILLHSMWYASMAIGA